MIHKKRWHRRKKHKPKECLKTKKDVRTELLETKKPEIVTRQVRKITEVVPTVNIQKMWHRRKKHKPKKECLKTKKYVRKELN